MTEDKVTVQDISNLEKELISSIEARSKNPEDVKQIARAIANKLAVVRQFLRARDWLEQGRRR